MSDARRVRVLVLDQGPGLWGAQRYLLRLRPLLAERGVDLTLACPPHLEQFRHWRSLGYSALPLDLPLERSIRKQDRIVTSGIAREGVRSVAVPRRIARLSRKGGFDVVLANSHWTHLDAAIAARLSPVRTVLTLHESTVPGLGSRLRDAAIGSAHHAVAVSDSVASTVSERLRRRVTVIRNGIDTNEFAPGIDELDRRSLRTSLGLGLDRRVLLAATRLDPSKRIEDLVDLAGALDDDATVVVAGTTSAYPEYERSVRQRAAALPDNRLIFLGPRDDIPFLLRAADLYVHTGLIEGMPLGVVEAQSAGVPVVAYEAAGVREAVLDGESGLVVPPSDVAALTVAARRLLDASQTRHEFAMAARRFAVTEHRIDLQADANAQILREIGGRRHRTGSARELVSRP
ncbi:glycosyltransferase family 4 protein [Gordonia sp. NPDC003429]